MTLHRFWDEKGLMNCLPGDVEAAITRGGGVGGDVVLVVARRSHAVLLDAVGPASAEGGGGELQARSLSG